MQRNAYEQVVCQLAYTNTCFSSREQTAKAVVNYEQAW